MENDSVYTSIEEIAAECEDYLLENGMEEIQGIYGISMGGSVAIRMLANGRIKIRKAVIDGGITPRSLPDALTWGFVIRDYSFMMMLKRSLKIFSKFVSKDKYGTETFERLRNVMAHVSKKTLWNNFKSCNMYTLPEMYKVPKTKIEYWYGSKEYWNRKKDIAYVRSVFLNVNVVKMKGFNHAEFVMLRPDAFAKKIKNFMNE